MKLTSSALVALAVVVPTFAQGQTLTFATAGGSFLETVNDACLKPYAEKTGLQIKAVATEDTAAQVRAQMMTKPQWDIVETQPDLVAIGAKAGWFEKLDWSILDPENKLPSFAHVDHAMGFATYSEGIGYRTDRNDGKVMSGWADFWDVEKFPGGRSMRDTPLRNLEYALIADGVPVADIYKLLATEEGVDRAFKKLDEIKPEVKIWWTAGQQPTQYLASGDVAYSTVWNGRIGAAQKDNVPVDFVWDQASMIIAYYSIMKGSPVAKEAHELLRDCWTSAEVSAKVVERIPYASFAPGLYDLLTPEISKQLTTYPANLEKQFVYDGAFWGEHRPALQERWQAWRLEN